MVEDGLKTEISMNGFDKNVSMSEMVSLGEGGDDSSSSKSFLGQRLLG